MFGNDSSLIDPSDFIDELIDADLNPEIFNLDTSDFPKCNNPVLWMKEKKYLGMTPWPRQVEILLNLFECYCPLCSDMSVVNDCWGHDLDYIFSKVVLLENGTCPHCKKNKRDYRQMGLIHDKHELVGVAGQRCLHPDMKVVTFGGDIIPLHQVEAGTWLRKQHDDGTPAIVEEVLGSIQPGYFELFVEGVSEIIHCSDQHEWPVLIRGKQRLLPTVELKEGMRLVSWDTLVGYRTVTKINKVVKQCKLIDLEMKNHEMFQSACGLMLHNSGKTALSAVITSYITHEYLTLPALPYEVLGLTPTTLRGTFVAVSKGQAAETLWKNYNDVIDANPWFIGYHDMLIDEGYRKGEEYFRRLSESIAYNNKRLAISFESANPQALRGRTRMFGGLDELGLFPSGPAYAASGQECYKSLNNSLRTIRSETNRMLREGAIDPPKAWMLNVSSPISEDDPIMPMLEVAKVDKKIYAFHLPTWKLNPRITQDDLKTEMLKDPRGFWRDFGAVPPTASDAFITQPQQVDALHNDVENAIRYEFGTYTQTVVGQDYHYRVLKVLGTRPHNNDYVRVLAIDAGESDNSYSFSIGYWDEERGRTVLEATAEIEPETTKTGQVVTVSFDKAFDLFASLLEPFQIEMAVADRWNSTMTLERLRDKKINAFKHSPKMPEFKLLRARVFNQEAEIPKLDADPTDKSPPATSPVARLAMQAKMVKEVGQRLLKPTIGSDDSFRSWALMDIIIDLYKDELITLRKRKIKRRNQKPGLFTNMPHRLRAPGGGSARINGAKAAGTISKNSDSFRRVKRPGPTR